MWICDCKRAFVCSCSRNVCNSRCCGQASRGQLAGSEDEEEDEDLRESLRRIARVPGEWLAGQT